MQETLIQKILRLQLESFTNTWEGRWGETTLRLTAESWASSWFQRNTTKEGEMHPQGWRSGSVSEYKVCFDTKSIHYSRGACLYTFVHIDLWKLIALNLETPNSQTTRLELYDAKHTTCSCAEQIFGEKERERDRKTARTSDLERSFWCCLCFHCHHYPCC